MSVNRAELGTENRAFWREPWVVAVVIGAAARTAASCLMPILPEEAYHWCYARHPALSYYDHPPMIAWMIALGRLIFGDTALGIRFVPLMGSIVTASAIGWISRRLHGINAATWTAFLVSIQPISIVGFGFGFPDAPLVMFWSLGMVCVVSAVERGRGIWWLAAGAALGAGLLSKYTACFLALSVFVYLVVSPTAREWLRSPWPYVGILVACILFSPVLLWNVHHDWASFRFQGVSRFQEMGYPRVRLAVSFLLGQWGAILPVTLPLAAAAVIRSVRRRTDADRFLLCVSLPVIVFFFIVGLTRYTHILWPLPGYLGLTILMGETAAQGAERIPSWYRAHWRWILGLTGTAALIGAVHALRPLPLVRPLRSTYEWTAIAARAQELKRAMPEDCLVIGIGRRYLCASQLAFHLRSPEVQAKNLLGEEGLQFAYWGKPQTLFGRSAVIVAEAEWASALERLLPRYFSRVEHRGEYTVGLRTGAPLERYLFLVAYEYRLP